MLMLPHRSRVRTAAKKGKSRYENYAFTNPIFGAKGLSRRLGVASCLAWAVTWSLLMILISWTDMVVDW
jgi:hypothetical protein